MILDSKNFIRILNIEENFLILVDYPKSLQPYLKVLSMLPVTFLLVRGPSIPNFPFLLKYMFQDHHYAHKQYYHYPLFQIHMFDNRWKHHFPNLYIYKIYIIKFFFLKI